jgi:WD40-like Beta Propeller Repeat
VPVRDGDLETLPVDDLPPHGTPRRARHSLPRLGRPSRRALGVVGVVAVVVALSAAAGGVVVARVDGAPSDRLSGGPRRIAMWTGEGRLDIVDRVTGAHRTIARDSPARPGTPSLAVSPDGRTLFFDRLAPSFATECGSAFANAEEVVSVPVRGGPVHLYGRGEFPAVSPDGRWLAFATRSDGSCVARQNVVAFVELGVSPTRTYRYPLLFRTAHGAQQVRITQLSWDPDSRSVLVAGSFAFDEHPAVVDAYQAIAGGHPPLELLAQSPLGRVAYRGARGQLLVIDGKGVIVAKPGHQASFEPSTLLRLAHIQRASTDASGRYFLLIDASARVFGWKVGLNEPRRVGSLQAASAIWIPDHDVTRLPTVDVSHSGSLDDAVRTVRGFCPSAAGRMFVRVASASREYTCGEIRGRALRRDLVASLRRHVGDARKGSRGVDAR